MLLLSCYWCEIYAACGQPESQRRVTRTPSSCPKHILVPLDAASPMAPLSVWCPLTPSTVSFGPCAGRKLTAILYLNSAWTSDDGGQLRLYPTGNVQTGSDSEPEPEAAASNERMVEVDPVRPCDTLRDLAVVYSARPVCAHHTTLARRWVDVW